MENMVWLDKLGIYDEELLKVNPKLVIVHISGLGNAKFGGVPSVCNRASLRHDRPGLLRLAVPAGL